MTDLKSVPRLDWRTLFKPKDDMPEAQIKALDSYFACFAQPPYTVAADGRNELGQARTLRRWSQADCGPPDRIPAWLGQCCCLASRVGSAPMKRAVWKFSLDEINADGEVVVSMPLGAEVLTAREQADTLCVWARVDPDEKRVVKRRFTVCGTGHPAPFTDYLGTGMLFGGTLVLHVFVVADGSRSVPR